MKTIPESTLELIQEIAAKVAKFYLFAGYTEEDLQQEAFLRAIEILPKYNEEKGDLRDFLYVSLSNYLNNFRKKNCYNAIRDSDDSVNRSKKLIHYAKPIQTDQTYEHKDFEIIDDEDMMESIQEYIPVNMRKDYERIKEGLHVHSLRRAVIMNKVNLIHFLLSTNNIDALNKVDYEDW